MFHAQAAISVAPSPAALTPAALVAHPRLLAGLQAQASANLQLYTYDRSLQRLTDSLGKLMLAGLIFRTWLRALDTTTGTVFCASQIADDALQFRLLSRNTVQSAVDKYIRYGLIERVGRSGDRRIQLLRVPDHLHQAVHAWTLSQLRLLDSLDGGTRGDTLAARPALLSDIHSRVFEWHLTAQEWLMPPPEVAPFCEVRHGFLVLNHLLSRLDPAVMEGSDFVVAPMSRSEVGRQLSLSRSNVHRLFAEAERAGAVRADGKRLLVATRFVEAYCRWQAGSFAALDATWLAVTAQH